MVTETKHRYITKVEVENFGVIQGLILNLTPLHALFGSNQSFMKSVFNVLNNTLCSSKTIVKSEELFSNKEKDSYVSLRDSHGNAIGVIRSNDHVFLSSTMTESFAVILNPKLVNIDKFRNAVIVFTDFDRYLCSCGDRNCLYNPTNVVFALRTVSEKSQVIFSTNNYQVLNNLYNHEVTRMPDSECLCDRTTYTDTLIVDRKYPQICEVPVESWRIYSGE